jgi:hypothetical protein
VSDVSATAIDLLVTDAKSIKLLPCWKLAHVGERNNVQRRVATDCGYCGCAHKRLYGFREMMGRFGLKKDIITKAARLETK